MMAALTAAQGGASVALLERNPKLGRKLYITGKGRCNVTNHCSVQEVLDSTPRNSRFLYGAMTRTPPAWVEDFFRQEGVPLKVERGNRVFPESDRAADIIDALFHALRRSRVRVIQDRARHILVEDGAVCGVAGEQGEHHCKAVILATGGASYPATGSTGDGYAMAAELGHTVVDIKPSLVPLEAEGDLCPRMQGLALKNVVLRVKNRMIGRQMGSCCSQIWISFIQPRWEETGSRKIFGWKEQMLWNIAEIRYWLQTVTFIKRVRTGIVRQTILRLQSTLQVIRSLQPILLNNMDVRDMKRQD